MAETYNTSLSLKQDDITALKKCQEYKYGIIDVFRMGLQQALEEIEMGQEMGGDNER